MHQCERFAGGAGDGAHHRARIAARGRLETEVNYFFCDAALCTLAKAAFFASSLLLGFLPHELVSVGERLPEDLGAHAHALQETVGLRGKVRIQLAEELKA